MVWEKSRVLVYCVSYKHVPTISFRMENIQNDTTAEMGVDYSRCAESPSPGRVGSARRRPGMRSHAPCTLHNASPNQGATRADTNL